MWEKNFNTLIFIGFVRPNCQESNGEQSTKTYLPVDRQKYFSSEFILNNFYFLVHWWHLY